MTLVGGTNQVGHHLSMARRRFLVTSLAQMLTLPFAEAEPAAQVYRVAIVYPAGNPEEITEPILLPELGRLGYVEGQNLVVERRSGHGRREKYSDVAREVVALRPDVIFTASGRMAEACRAMTSRIPIVTIASDPVALGLAASLRRPGGNVTGFTVDAGVEAIAKRLEFLREAVPHATRVAFLTTRQAWDGKWGRVMRETAERAGMVSIPATVNDPLDGPEYRRVFAVMANERAQAMVVTDHAEAFASRGLIVELAAFQRLPAIYPYREFVETGGFMAYAFDSGDVRRHVAHYIDRILKGANPARLPFQQPTKFYLDVNLKTARALGLTIPPALLARADQVIE